MSGARPGRPVLGFVGVGQIGTPIVECLLRAGFDLVLNDIREAATAPFASRARITATAGEVAAQSDAIFVCLVTPAAYRDAVLGPWGVAQGGRAKTYIHVGTTGPSSVREMAAALAPRGMTAIDAAVTGGVARAREGKLTSIVSGPRAAVDAMAEAIGSYSGKVVYLGEEPGLAQTMKLVNNMLSISSLAIACEVMVVGRKAGLTAAQLLDVINSGTGQCNATLTKVPNNIVPRKFDVGSALHSVLKDLDAYRNEAKACGIDSAVCEAVMAAYRRAAEQGTFDDDISTVIRPFERAAGVELK